MAINLWPSSALPNQKALLPVGAFEVAVGIMALGKAKGSNVEKGVGLVAIGGGAFLVMESLADHS